MSESLPRLVEPETFDPAGSPGTCLIHVAEARAYQAAHLPGAVLVEPRELIGGEPPAPGRLPDVARLEALFGALGYRPDRHFVVYDDEGGGWAGRFIWTLDVIGHDAWSYLNGGLHAWHALGRPLESGPGRRPEPTTVRVAIDRRPIADLCDVLAAIGDPGQLVWDARSPEEYRGDKSGSRRSGHVPTAVNLDWMCLKDPARALRLPADLETRLAESGIHRGKRVITHCQTHHRSGLSYLAARLLGFPDIRAYDASWGEWGNRDDTPVATGPEPGRPEARAQR